MPPAPILRHALLDDTAAALGKDYLQQLVTSLARHSGAQLVFISQPLSLPVQHVEVMVANQPAHPGRYALADRPCGQVISQQQALQFDGAVNKQFAAEADTAWQSFAGWPLLDSHGQCLGHLALFDERTGSLPASLLAEVAPFVTRAAAEVQRLQQERLSSLRASQEARHSHFLRQYLKGSPLPALLDEVVLQIESSLPGWICSILRVDGEQRLRPLAGPSLPPAYTAKINGLPIGPTVGSCGAAAWHRKRLVAEDLQQHPNWAPYRELASEFALGSCWSEPIIDSKGKVHGTFAVYHRAPSAPTVDAITIIEDTARLLAVLMENDANRQALDSRTQWYQAILQNAADALSIIDMDGRVLEASDSLCKLLGYSQAEIRQLQLWDMVAQRSEAELREQLAHTSDTPLTFDSLNRTKDGQIIEVEVSVRRLMLDGQPVVWGSARDISLRKQQERLLREQATIDSLTGLYNRPTLLAQLDTLLASPAHTTLALLMLDLDHFKQVNDHYGHACGDATLAHMASQMRQLLGPHDYAGRLGGEEFCVLLAQSSPDAAARYSQRLLAVIQQQPLVFAGQTIRLTASIGLSRFQPGDDSRSLLARADMALYQAKHQGRNRMVMLPP
jgi:diguanylate cyclase (GGDEF)-like protein/PAS domain S-box-containing protein